MSLGRGRLSRSSELGVVSSSSMISLQRSMHSSQMYTPGPAISFFTCRCDFPQKLQRSCSFPSLARAIRVSFYPESRVVPRPVPRLGRSLDPPRLTVSDHGIDDAVVLGFLWAHEEISLHIPGDLLLGLAGVTRVNLLQTPLQADHLAGLDLDIGALPLEPAGHLVDQDP